MIVANLCVLLTLLGLTASQAVLPVCNCNRFEPCVTQQRIREQQCETQCSSQFQSLGNAPAIVLCHQAEMASMRQVDQCIDQQAGKRCAGARRKRQYGSYGNMGTNGNSGNMGNMNMGNGNDHDGMEGMDDWSTGNQAFDQAMGNFMDCVSNCMLNITGTGNNNNWESQYGEVMDDPEMVCAKNQMCRLKEQPWNKMEQAWNSCQSGQNSAAQCQCYVTAGISGINCNKWMSNKNGS